MLRKSIFTKLFSGASALAVAASGVNAVSSISINASNEIPDAFQNTLSSLSEAFDSLNAAMEGNSEFAYNANLNLKLSETEMGIKPIDVSALIQQKDKKTSADVNVKYDAKSAVTLNAVYDHENEIAYLKVPEINNAYLSVKNGELYNFGALINALFPSDDNDDDYDYDDDYGYEDDSDYDDEYDDDYEDEDALEDLDIEKILSIIENIDLEALEEDILSYLDIIESKISVENGNNLEGEINGHKYNYSSQVYTITGADIQAIVNDAADKVKNDDIIKDIALQLGISETEYSAVIDEIVKDVNDMRPSELEDKMTVTVYMNGENIAGLAVDDDYKAIFVEDGNFLGIETATVQEVYEGLTASETTKGWVTADGNLFNGSFEKKTEYSDGTYDSELTEFNNVSFENGVFSGVIKTRTESKLYEDEDAEFTEKIITSSSTADKINITYVKSQNGNEIMSLTLTGEKTVPNDIMIPTENVYSMGSLSDIAEYAASSDLQGFLMNLKNVLGDELFNELFGEMMIDPEPVPDSEPDSTDKPDSSGNGDVTSKKPVSDSDKDKSPDTGSAAGISLAAVILTGFAVIASKKK